jgi:alkylhydroperoxidase family enzyme
MLRSLEKVIFRKITPWSIRYLHPPDYRKAGGLAREVFLQLECEFQLVPPVTLHHANPILMAGVWSACRESLIAGSGERPVKEAVAATVSGLNTCPYCIEAHVSMLPQPFRRRVASAVRSGNYQPDAEPLLDRAVQWAAATLTPGSRILSQSPFSADDAPAVMATALFFHYINRMANVFLDKVMMPLLGRVPVISEAASGLFSTKIAGRIASLDVAPGRYLTVRPEGRLPLELRWAERDRFLSEGLLRFDASIGDAAEESVDEDVRELVISAVEAWNGEQPGFGDSRIDRAVSLLPDGRKASAALALKVALASWTVDGRVIRAFRQYHDDDRALLNTAAWGAYLAAKRIAGWLQSP